MLPIPTKVVLFSATISTSLAGLRPPVFYFVAKPVSPQQGHVPTTANVTELHPPRAHPIAGRHSVLAHGDRHSPLAHPMVGRHSVLALGDRHSPLAHPMVGRHSVLALGVGHSPRAHPLVGLHSPQAQAPPASASNRLFSGPPSVGNPDSAMAVPSEPNRPPRSPATPHAHDGGAEGSPPLPATAHAAPPTAALSSAPQPPL
jgi:hypothetical protein